MNGKKARAKKADTMVDITKIRLGLDVTSGRVIIGVANDDGTIEITSLTQDVTQDFYTLVQEIMQLRKMAEDAKPKIVQPTKADLKVLKL